MPVHDLLTASVRQLAAAIRSREVSALEVVDAHLLRIEVVNSRLNAVVRLLADTAREQAKACDTELARGASRGPLHGVPFTIKDAWEVEGVISTAGTLGRKNYVGQRDATVVRRLKDAGAIPIGMTNLPDLSLAFESDNLVHGRTNNPYDLARTPGGSGGGGSAIIAAGGSPIEPGGDAGGSIRLPCHFTGIAGLKVTLGRVPLTGYFPPSAGVISMVAVGGPMARRVDDLALTLPILSGPDGVDPVAVPAEFRDPSAVDVRSLRVAMHTDNGIVAPEPEIAAIVRAAAKSLSDSGAAVEEKRPPGLEQTHDLFMTLICGDGCAGLRALIGIAGSERIHPLLASVVEAGERYGTSAAGLGKALADLSLFRAALLAFMHDYDVILCPVAPFAALPHGHSIKGDVFPGFSYTMAHNLSGFPGASVRCGEAANGLPVNVQVVARPWREDVALAVAERLETVFGGWRIARMDSGATAAV